MILLLHLSGMSPVQGQVAPGSDLSQEILRADSILFEAGYNNCDLQALDQLTGADFVFYHDQGGITRGKEDFIEGIRRNICSLDYRPLRKLVEGSTRIYPLYANGSLYGAIQNGTHAFYAREEDKEPSLTSTARFTHLWIRDEDGWQLQTVLSFDHQSPETPYNQTMGNDQTVERMVGLWEVKEVTIGEETMTPVAKWTRLKDDGTYQSGNGWLQNAQGTWEYDASASTFSATDTLDMGDDFGAFSVSFEGNNMIWERQEEGMTVRVTLSPTDKLPMAPADYLEGVWKLVQASGEESQELTQVEASRQHRLFFRWDRIYIHFSPTGERTSGYWHIDSHQPRLTLLSHDPNQTPQSWSIEVDEETLIMTGTSEDNQGVQRKYTRRRGLAD